MHHSFKANLKPVENYGFAPSKFIQLISFDTSPTQVYALDEDGGVWHYDSTIQYGSWVKLSNKRFERAD